MTSVIISSNDPQVGQTISKKTADILGYDLVGPPLLEQVGTQYSVSPDKLRRVLDGTASRIISGKNRNLLLAFIRSATLERLLEDNVVCLGLAAHLYVRHVSHVLMVRVLADPTARLDSIAAEKKISERRARKLIERESASRIRWSMENFGLNEEDPAIYDMVISLSQIEIDKAVDIIRDMASYRKFQPMTYSRKCLGDLALASTVSAALLSQYPDIRVGANGDTAIVHVKCPKRQKKKVVEIIKKSAGEISGVARVEVHAMSSTRDLQKSNGPMSGV